MNATFWGIRRVWMRYFDVFRRNILYYLITTFSEPFLYLMAFGFGVGGLVGEIEVHARMIPYRDFVFAGIIAQTILFQSFFEAAYGGFIRMYYQKIFQSISVTPITLSEVLWGELLWGASRATLAAEAVILIGVAMGTFAPITMLVALPLIFVASLLFGGLGLLTAALARNIEQINYPQYLLVFPMFLFCGVFYPVETLPEPLLSIAWVLPLTSVTSLLRTIALDFPIQPIAIGIVLTWAVVLVTLSRGAMTRRLIK